MNDINDAICKVANIDDIGNLSDGYHTFNQLYYQRMMLFATIVKQNRHHAWKSLRHEDGELCFGGGWFIVGVDTPEGSYTYHYEDKYYSLFDCEELERSKQWDGHTEKDVTRLLSLPSADQGTDEWCTDCKEYDHEKNCCPRFNRVIRNTVQKKGKWIPVRSYDAFGGDEKLWMLHGNPIAFYCCSECNEQAYASEYGDSLLTKYCPYCGARMVEDD